MFDPVVRRATLEDVSQLQLLEREARAALVGSRGGDRWLLDNPARGDRWAACVTDQHVFVGTVDDVVVGYIVGELDGVWARVREPFVHPQARECGFGDALLAALIESVKQAGATTLDGEALPGDRDTKNLYERAGIKARLIITSVDLL